ncbi:hypothetical protein [Streptomyces nitrosporeus]|uniref:Uncharacterized protein n=1 Tax=Streptomyces nitrosporeus TaxID=28894 RepID=A0A5J6F847_9ACTN|nr:hypothetical protein [Streptomyces nitrosporeus]QEU72498.1 hypothetical protein CP967_11270 [Streptomyces nitrosporeus]GGY77449.1 hypothetical protein GCM10010327_04460 [Streptomyces nitrosporeus]
METTSRAEADGAPGTDPAEGGPAARRTVDGYLKAPFPWYGLDDAFTGERWLMQVTADAEGVVQHGCTGHGEEPVLRFGENAEKARFAVVVTVGAGPLRHSGDGTGVLEAVTASSAALLAGSGLLTRTWPAQMDHVLRSEWLSQQTETAFALADELGQAPWSSLSLPVDGVPVDFHYRESEFGWVLAGSAPDGVHIGAYGRGLSAYGLGFAVIGDIRTYEN